MAKAVAVAAAIAVLLAVAIAAPQSARGEHLGGLNRYCGHGKHQYYHYLFTYMSAQNVGGQHVHRYDAAVLSTSCGCFVHVDFDRKVCYH
jgi:hypothetical protein